MKWWFAARCNVCGVIKGYQCWGLAIQLYTSKVAYEEKPLAFPLH